jgi:serine/threonine protein kinase
MERERAFFGPYRLLRRLGGGGAGDVYLAEGPTQPGQPPRQVALKVVRANAENPITQQLGRDVTRAAALNDKHIIPVHGVVTDGGALGVVMAYAQGGSLADELGQPNLVPLPLAPEVVARIVTHLARALGAAHAVGLAHGDIKPSNIFVRTASHGTPLATLSDFGQGFLTPLAAERAQGGGRTDQSQWILDLLRFAAPERLHDVASPASDQYALAAVAYYLLTGKHLFPGDQRQLADAIAHDPITPPSALNPALRPEVDRILQRALAKGSDQRFPTILAFAEALGSALEATAHLEGASPRSLGPQAAQSMSGRGLASDPADFPADAPQPIRRWLTILASGAILAAILTCLLSWRLIGGGAASLQLQGDIQRFLGPNSVSTSTPSDNPSTIGNARAAEAQLAAALATTPLFADPLMTNTQGWKTPDSSVFFAGDGLHVSNHTAAAPTLIAAPKPTNALSNAVTRARMTVLKGSADDLAGVCFLSRIDSAGKPQFYCYLASSEGRYEVWYYSVKPNVDHWQYLTGGYSPALKTGVGQTNELAVLTNMKDNTATLYANGKYVGKSVLAAGGPSAGGSGLLVLNIGAEAAFTQFAVYAPPQ